MKSFKTRYRELNAAQKKAVDDIDGPVLVIAGPGTGKTEIISLRVANIIKQTDTAPGNILCLTFTDNAARNMRERLESTIGQAAFHINIHTFHSFGAEIINQYPDFFIDRELIQQVDELGNYQLLKELFDKLPHSSPLSIKIGDEYIMLKDTLSIIGWLKQSALTPADLHDIIQKNQSLMTDLSELIKITFETPTSPKELKNYQKLLKAMGQKATKKTMHSFPEYAVICKAEFAEAINQTDPNSRFAPQITAWRNRWCVKNADGQHVFKDGGKNGRKLLAVANIYQEMIDLMKSRGLYDFDDMIVETVQALEKSNELKLNLQEKFLYVLVDEFQDTNKAQLRILEALGDNPVFESRPNIMAVGDDDQAIYSFQGAEISNMVAFTRMYQDTSLITLINNYRSTDEIIDTSYSIANQITDRLENIFPDTHKQLKAQTSHKLSNVSHNVLPSELAQYQWIAEQVNAYINSGTRPEQIAILAPRHRYLERLIPYLATLKLPVSYERRENILEAPLTHQLLTMSRLVLAIADNNQHAVDTLFGEVLSYDFWDIQIVTLLAISINCYDKHLHWLPSLLKHKNPKLNQIAKWFISLAGRSTTEPLEYVLDNLLGVVDDGADSEQDEIERRLEKKLFISPMRDYYFGQSSYNKLTDVYLALLGQLSTLRQRLRQWKPAKPLYIKDLIEFADLHTEAKLKIIDTNPHTQSTNAVQVMTAYKAKGLEFEIVFLINAQDEIWGPTSRSRSPRISLPKNLPLAPASDGDNDKLRLLFVAMSRAKHTLMVTSYSHTLENKLSPGLSFIGGNSTDSQAISNCLSPQFINRPSDVKAAEILATDWTYRFRHVIADKPTLFEPILASYKLSVTHLNNFIDITDAGPDYFLTHNLLRFPQALTPPAAYGDAMHKTLQWTHSSYRNSTKLPRIKQIQDYFVDMLTRKHLRTSDFERLKDRGLIALALYMKHRSKAISRNDLVERGFNNEGVVINGARLSGKIDKIHFVDNATVEVIDFKTGKPSESWRGREEYEKVKLHKYKQQLMFYKLLIENSSSFAGKVKVNRAALEFIEPNEDGKLVNDLVLDFDTKELERFQGLIGAVWQRISNLDMPDASQYKKDLSGILKFEEDLLEETAS